MAEFEKRLACVIGADGSIARIRSMEQSRQTLTPEQREKLRAMFAARWQRGPQGPGAGRGMAPQDGTNQPTASAEADGSATN